MHTILGIGTDIVEIDRIRKAIRKHGQILLNRLFSSSEQKYCQQYRNPYASFAARFCAKEALAKALGEGFGENLSFLDIEIRIHATGQPYISLSQTCAHFFSFPVLHLSLAHSKYYATAVVIACHHHRGNM